MKLRSIALAWLSAMTLAGCIGNTLDFRNAEISNGKLYQEGANEPFSGKVTNIPYFKLPTTPLLKVFDVVSKLTQDSTYRETFFAGGLAAALGMASNSKLLCDAEFDKGTPDGKVVCTLSRADAPLVTFRYEKGALEGPVTVASYKAKSVTVAEASYKLNAIDGVLVINHPETGQLLSKSNWKAGALHGREEDYSLTTGKLIFKGSYVDGKPDGEAVRYNDDGTEMMRSIYQSGQLVQSVDHRAGSPSLETCVSLWTSAYRKEVGEDAVITADQLGEWNIWCNEGKRP